MAYDPQAGRRRPKPDAEAPAPVDALLGEAPATPATAPGRTEARVADDPPPSVSVTPEPADPVPDRLLLSTGVAAAMRPGSVIAKARMAL